MKNTYLDLFLTFARIGGLTFGGGYAMFPILEKEIVENRHWATEEDLADYYAIGQCTPGIIAVNTATFIGNKVKGKLGGIIATLGVVFPSLIIITLIAAFLRNFADNYYVQEAFSGIRVVVTVLVLNTVIKLFKSNVRKKALWVWILFFAVLILSYFVDVPSVILVLAAAVCGIICSLGSKKVSAASVVKGGDKK